MQSLFGHNFVPELIIFLLFQMNLTIYLNYCSFSVAIKICNKELHSSVI